MSTSTPMSPDDIIAAAVATAKNRLTYYYDVPEALAERTGIKELGLVKLLASEEVTAAKRAGASADMALELVKESLRRVNGKPVTTADGTVDVEIERMDPEVRGLLASAYNELHNAKNEDVKSFLASRRAKVG